jgi:uncharacterized protein
MILHLDMQSPFLFGKTVSADGFTNRTKDMQRLKANFANQVNTIIISPRRWGKSSLVKKVAAGITGRQTKVVMLDMMGIRNEEGFYKAFAAATIRATSNKVEEWIATGKQFLKNVTPKISIGSDPLQELDISFEWKSAEKNYQEILNLPEKIALAKNIKIIVCLDEFQNLAGFNEPELFQKRLRTEWQHHTKVCYCLYGSRQHMMTELFTKQSKAFYKFGEILYLPKIQRQEWVKFIQQQFITTKKKISEQLADEIAATVKDHSYYVQQLSHLVWIKTEKTATQNILQDALEDLLTQNAILYSRDTENLTTPQFNFLKALADGITKNFSSKEIINRYELGTSANVLKIKKALIQKELIDDSGSTIEFLDPAYELWFQKNIQTI